LAFPANRLSAAARANPTVVANPATRPAFSYASGTIDVVIIVMIAPAANASTKAIVPGDAPSSRA
jgi:hypothetical protein